MTERKPQKTLGEYILLEKLSSGGMAEVWLAKTVGANNLSKFVAIKFIHDEHAMNRQYQKMFVYEAKVAINLSHQNVVSMLDFKMDKGRPYLVMEYLPGKTLSKFAARAIVRNQAQMPLHYIVYIIREAAMGLSHSHNCLNKSTNSPMKIIHRDMSPQNIVITHQGEVKLIDFGIAKTKLQTEETRFGTIKGKVAYMSPEQAMGSMELDQTTDIFSLGIVFWELICGEKLFARENELATLECVRNCEVPDPKLYQNDFPDELSRIMRKALTEDRRQRYQTALEFANDLTKFLNKNHPNFTAGEFCYFASAVYKPEIEAEALKFIEYSKIRRPDTPVMQETVMPLLTTAKLTEETQSITHTEPEIPVPATTPTPKLTPTPISTPPPTVEAPMFSTIGKIGDLQTVHNPSEHFEELNIPKDAPPVKIDALKSGPDPFGQILNGSQVGESLTDDQIEARRLKKYLREEENNRLIRQMVKWSAIAIGIVIISHYVKRHDYFRSSIMAWHFKTECTPEVPCDMSESSNKTRAPANTPTTGIHQ